MVLRTEAELGGGQVAATKGAIRMWRWAPRYARGRSIDAILRWCCMPSRKWSRVSGIGGLTTCTAGYRCPQTTWKRQCALPRCRLPAWRRRHCFARRRRELHALASSFPVSRPPGNCTSAAMMSMCSKPDLNRHYTPLDDHSQPGTECISSRSGQRKEPEVSGAPLSRLTSSPCD
jgi:hypothetical protein